jgi:hypothetical protein
MLRISKIVSCKFVETLQELLYTALANSFSNTAPAYTRKHHVAGLSLINSKSNASEYEGEGFGHLYGSPEPRHF